MDKEQLKRLITTAFEGVGLGKGMSLLSAEVADDWGRLPSGMTLQQYQARLREEITQNWALLKPETLKGFHVFAHLDPKGLRYYLPAYMILALQGDADDISIEFAVYTLNPGTTGSRSWDYHIHRYSLFTEAQRIAIAQFLYWLPYVVEFDSYYAEDIQEAIDNYWHQYLHTFICAVDFELAAANRFQRLQKAFARFKSDKENKTRTAAEDWLLYFDDQALSHFQWPNQQANADLWQHWYLIPEEERRDNPIFFSAPWHFEFWLEAIYDADYRLESCDPMGTGRGRLTYSCLKGSVEALEALIAAFEGKVTGRVVVTPMP